MSESPNIDSAGPTLSDSERRLHRLLIDAMLEAGELPPASALASELGTDVEELRKHLRALADADYIGFDQAGQLTCLYPFSAVAKPHVVIIGEKRRFAMCSLDALGMAAMLGRAVDIESSCPVCGTPILLSVRPGAIDRVDPTSTVVVAKRDGDAPAFETCCDFTVFACCPEHADALVARTSGSSAFDVVTALGVGESIFGKLLDETLPATRRRGTIPKFGDVSSTGPPLNAGW